MSLLWAAGEHAMRLWQRIKLGLQFTFSLINLSIPSLSLELIIRYSVCIRVSKSILVNVDALYAR